MLTVMAVLGIAIFLAAGFVGWRKRVQIQIWLNDRQLAKHAIFWAIMATVYVGLLTLGGYLKHGNFMLTVSVIFAIIAVAGKKSLDQFGTDKFHQVAQISLLIVAIATWLWPTMALVATLPVVFAMVWVLNVTADRWGFSTGWGRVVVTRFVQVTALIVISWSVFKFTFPELAPALGSWVRSSEAMLAEEARSTRLGIHFKPGTKKPKDKPATPSVSAPLSQADIARTQSAIKAMPKRGLMTKDELAKLSESLAGDRIPVTAKPPTVAEVVAANPTGATPLPPLPAIQTAAKQTSPKTSDVLDRLKAELRD